MTDLWEDEGKWRLQFRCKICADAIGELADIAVCDAWPGGGPTGEDEGFNGFIARTRTPRPRPPRPTTRPRPSPAVTTRRRTT